MSLGNLECRREGFRAPFPFSFSYEGELKEIENAALRFVETSSTG